MVEYTKLYYTVWEDGAIPLFFHPASPRYEEFTRLTDRDDTPLTPNISHSPIASCH